MKNTADNIVPLTSHGSYKEAGVDTQEAEVGLRGLVRNIMETWPPPSASGEVKIDIGYFANVIEFCGQGLAICADGAGSKAIIAEMMQRYDTIGIDCVAMNVNDLICVGARPISMVDYIAVESADSSMLEELSVGLSEGAKRAEISIPGGEIAQLKDIVSGFDIVGMAIGHVPLDRVIIGQNIKEGDVLIGIESSGIHSNGLTLARRAFFELNQYSIGHKFDELDDDLGTELLRPTHIYVREVLDLLERIDSIKALVHITSDGFLNLARVHASVGFVLDTLPPVPPIFKLIQQLGHVDTTEMYEVYNMGVGFVVIVDPADEQLALSVLNDHKRRAQRIGYAREDSRKRLWLQEQELVGEGKTFLRSELSNDER